VWDSRTSICSKSMQEIQPGLEHPNTACQVPHAWGRGRRGLLKRMPLRIWWRERVPGALKAFKEAWNTLSVVCQVRGWGCPGRGDGLSACLEL
jgi:hypothetical protein